MAYVAVDKNETEWVYNEEPVRGENSFGSPYECVELPKGSLEKLIGRRLTWKDEPVEIEKGKNND